MLFQVLEPELREVVESLFAASGGPPDNPGSSPDFGNVDKSTVIRLSNWPKAPAGLRLSYLARDRRRRYGHRPTKQRRGSLSAEGSRSN